MMFQSLFWGPKSQSRIVTAKDVEERLRETREALLRWSAEGDADAGGCDCDSRSRERGIRGTSLGVQEDLEDEDEALLRLESWWSSQNVKGKSSKITATEKEPFQKPFKPPSIPIDIDEDETFFEGGDDVVNLRDSGLGDSDSVILLLEEPEQGTEKKGEEHKNKKTTRMEKEDLNVKLQEQTNQFQQLKQEVREVQATIKEFLAKMNKLEKMVEEKDKDQSCKDCRSLENKVYQDLSQMLIRVDSFQEGVEEVVVPPTPPRGPIELHNGHYLTQEEYNNFYRDEYLRLKKKLERKSREGYNSYSPIKAKISEYVDFISPLRKKLNLTEEECSYLRKPIEDSAMETATETVQDESDRRGKGEGETPPAEDVRSTIMPMPTVPEESTAPSVNEKEKGDKKKRVARVLFQSPEPSSSTQPAPEINSIVPSISDFCGGNVFAAFLASLRNGEEPSSSVSKRKTKSPEMPMLEPMIEIVSAKVVERQDGDESVSSFEVEEDRARDPTFSVKNPNGRPKRGRGRPRKDLEVAKPTICRNLRKSKREKKQKIKVDNLSQSNSKLRDRKIYVCYTCGATFSTKSVLFEHQNDTHNILMVD